MEKINKMTNDELLFEWNRFKKGIDDTAIYKDDITVFEYCQMLYSEISSRGLKIR